MVHKKARSGDPDYDDKVPLEQQLGETTTDADGNEVLITEANGPIRMDTHEHANLDTPSDELDNRPAPGGVATEPSEVQTYTREDVTGRPAKSASKGTDKK